MTRSTLIGSLAAGLAALMVSGAVGSGAFARADDALTEAAPEMGPLVSGEMAVVDGTHVWTDYAYDEFTAGYPGERNAADIIQVQLRPDGDDLHVRVLLETLTDTATPHVTVALDTDNDPATGASTFEGWDWAPSGSAGADIVAELRETTPGVTIDADANTIETTIALGDHNADAIRALVIAGVADSTTPIDLAFVGNEDPSGWQNARQTSVLAGAGTVADAMATIVMGEVGNTTSDIRQPGFHTLLYRSDVPGEGIGTFTVSGPGGTPVPLGDRHDGRYQPYLAWVPEELPENPATVVFLHGLTGNHLSLASAVGPGGIDPNAVVVMPLGRGAYVFFLGTGEQDVLDVTDDALARWSGDADHVVLSGVSMGGFGTYRLGVRYPDRWSALVSLIGTGMSNESFMEPVPAAIRDQVLSPSRFLGGTNELLDNISNLPLRMVNGQVDPIVNNAFVTSDIARLQTLGYDYHYWALLRRHHETVPAISDCIFDEAVGRTRVNNPARVVLKVEPATYYIEPSENLSLRYDRAYWVSNVEVRDGGGLQGSGRIDVTTLAHANRDVAVERLAGAGNNFTAPQDLCGNPVGQTQDAWIHHGIALGSGPTQQTANALTMKLERLSTATLDTSRAGLDSTAELVLDVDTDGPTTLRLTGGWVGDYAISLNGTTPTPVTADDGTIAIPISVSGQMVITPING